MTQQPALDWVPEPEDPAAIPTGEFSLLAHLEAVTNYGPVIFTDAAHQFGRFFAVTGGYTAQGYPIGDAISQAFMRDCPAGTYDVFYEGTAKLNFGYSLTNVSTVGGVTKGQFTIPADKAGQSILLRVTGSSAADPLRNLHVWIPGEDRTKTFRKAFLDDLASSKLQGLRFGDWCYMNHARPVHWADRVAPENWDQADFGVAYELQVELVKEALARGAKIKHVFVNVPLTADADFIRRMADAYLELAKLGVIVHEESGNETWNDHMGTDSPFRFCWATANPGDAAIASWFKIPPPTIAVPDGTTPASQPATRPTVNLWDGRIINGKFVPSFDRDGNQVLVTDARTRAARCAAERAMKVGKIWRAEFGRSSTNLRVCWSGQCGWTAWAQNGADFIDAQFGDVGGAAAAFDELLVAPYFTFGHELDSIPTPTDAQALKALNDFIEKDLAAQLDAHWQICQQHHWKLNGYEGGQHLLTPKVWDAALNAGKGAFRDPTDAEVTASIQCRLQTHPLMQKTYEHWLTVCHRHHVSVLNDFTWLGSWSKFGFWSKRRSYADDTPKIRAIRHWLASLN